MSATTPEVSQDYRPVLHYTAADTWLNDPNGLIHHNGLYHLYYQNNPHGALWGNMSWGHATSPDLVHWSEHPVAIPCDDEEQIFSGSIVFDQHNSSGLGTADKPPLVAVYTSAFREGTALEGIQAQSLAYSLDGGFNWTKYRSNPVLTRGSSDFRDPKVFRYADSESSFWVMVAVEALDRKVLLYRSQNLLDWSPMSEFGPANAVGGIWECPDLFPLPLDGDPSHTKWVLTVNINPGGPNGGSAGQYFVGRFDGAEFISETTATHGPDDEDRTGEYRWLDWGRDYYAAVSFNDAPHGRRIMIGWMNNWDYADGTPSSPWRGSMSLPRELSLVTIAGTPHLRQLPISELEAHHTEPLVMGPFLLDDEVLPITTADYEASLIEVQFQQGTAAEFGLLVHAGPTHGTRVAIDPGAGILDIDRSASGSTGFHPTFSSRASAPIDRGAETYTLRVYLDRCSVEVFAQEGLVPVTSLVFPPGGSGLSLFARRGTATAQSIAVSSLGLP